MFFLWVFHWINSREPLPLLFYYYYWFFAAATATDNADASFLEKIVISARYCKIVAVRAYESSLSRKREACSIFLIINIKISWKRTRSAKG